MRNTEQPNSAALQLLPRRREAPMTRMFNARPTQFYSNIFEIKLKKDCMVIYQYSLDISPEIPADSDGLIDKISKTIAFELKKSVGLLCSRGLMVWGRKEMKTVLTCKAEFVRNEQQLCFEVLVKPTKQIGLESFMSQNIQNLPSIIQVLNINAKKKLRDDNMVELYPGSYYESQTINNNKVEGKLNVWRGFDITVATYNKKIYLQVDPCSRVLRQESFLQTIEEERKKLDLAEVNLKYKGSPVLRRYGTPKIYKIEEIDYKMNPKCNFYFTKEGKQVSYIYYYEKEYSVKIKNPNQPLIKVSQVKKMKFLKEGYKEYIYLVPELVSLTGLTEQQKADFRLMKNLSEFTKLTAQERMKETKKMLGFLQGGKEELMFQIDETPKPIQGFKMPPPLISLGKNRQAPVNNGTIHLKQKVLETFTFTDVLFCYSIGRSPQQDQQDADDAYDLLKTASKTFGIEIKAPYFIEVKGGFKLEDWTRQLLKEKQSMKKQDKVDIVIFLMKPGEKSLYGDLKKFITYEYNCPSQVATRKVLSRKAKSGLSAASKIILQMNVKIGKCLWEVKNEHKIWQQNIVAVAGIASSKGKGGLSLGFTGTTNAQLTKYFCDCKILKKKEDMCIALFQNIYIQWLQNWFMKNEKKLPKVLIIYREGINQVQARFQSQFEIKGLLEAVQKVKEKSKVANYNPSIVYILVNKKPNSRIFEGESKGKNIDFYNPAPGSVIFDDLSQGYKEFHLASAVVREGTCTPVSFKVAYENRPDVPLEALCELTYNQTYSYYNWTGSVRVPAALQYANKLAKQYSDIGDELRTEEKNSDLKSKLFFL